MPIVAPLVALQPLAAQPRHPLAARLRHPLAARLRWLLAARPRQPLAARPRQLLAVQQARSVRMPPPVRRLPLLRPRLGQQAALLQLTSQEVVAFSPTVGLPVRTQHQPLRQRPAGVVPWRPPNLRLPMCQLHPLAAQLPLTLLAAVVFSRIAGLKLRQPRHQPHSRLLLARRQLLRHQLLPQPQLKAALPQRDIPRVAEDSLRTGGQTTLAPRLAATLLMLQAMLILQLQPLGHRPMLRRPSTPLHLHWG